MKLYSAFPRMLHKSKFIRYGFLMNEGIWAHMIGAGIIANIIQRYISASITVLIVFCIAVLWECIEAYLETPNKTEILHVYKSKEQYIYDSIADIIGAVIIAVLVVF